MMIKRIEENNDSLWLSAVVIGRNEESRLPALFKSLPSGDDIEWIYVDSQSKDNSVKIALDNGAKVYLVDEDSIYAAGTGRYVGSKEAGGKWILYLDGDMVLSIEFRVFLERLKKAVDLPPQTAGFVGRTSNHFLDRNGEVAAVRDYVVLEEREMGKLEDWGKPVVYHGGAVLYRRDYVLRAGNWNPAVHQLEEIDLCSRIRALGGILRAVDLPMADHYTPYLNTLERIKLNFLPRWRGKNLFGAGQVVAARFKAGTLWQFARYYPYPFIVLIGIVSAPFFYLIWPPLPLLFNAAIAVWLGIIKKWYYYLVYLGNLLQIFRGLGRYRPFEPRYRQVNQGRPTSIHS